MKLTEQMLVDHFDMRSFKRGEEYQTDGHVFDAIRTDDLLCGRVAGSQYEPYRVKVRVKGKEIEAECSCPVGTDCKHAVALSLEFVRTTEDFIDAANALLKYDRYDEALDTIRKAPKEFVVKMKYFEILDDIPKKEIKRYWNITEAAENAFKEPGPLSSHIEWDTYNRIKVIFEKADAVDDMIEMAERIIPRTEILAKLFLYEGYPEKAALVFERNAKISGDIGMSIGSMAWKQRKKDLAMNVTRVALARGLGFRKKLDPADCKIIGELLKRTPKKELSALVSSFKMDGPLLKFIAQTLVPIRPDISHDLLDKNFERLDGEFVVKMIKDMGKKSPEISISLGVKAFEAFSGRSHIYYGVMIDMLKAVKPSYSRVHGTNGWDQYILELKKRFKTKKKLVNMIDNM